MTMMEPITPSGVYGNLVSTTIISLLRAVSSGLSLVSDFVPVSLGHLESPSKNVILTLLYTWYTSFHDDLEENPNI